MEAERATARQATAQTAGVVEEVVRYYEYYE